MTPQERRALLERRQRMKKASGSKRAIKRTAARIRAQRAEVLLKVIDEGLTREEAAAVVQTNDRALGTWLKNHTGSCDWPPAPEQLKSLLCN